MTHKHSEMPKQKFTYCRLQVSSAPKILSMLHRHLYSIRRILPKKGDVFMRGKASFTDKRASGAWGCSVCYAMAVSKSMFACMLPGTYRQGYLVSGTIAVMYSDVRLLSYNEMCNLYLNGQHG